jgi:GntR family transcriptional regulator, carbon starvation induced regulator
MTINDTLATQCFSKIRDLILSGDILPGEKLKGDALKQQLNVGLSPIREALSRLATTDLVSFEDKKGFSVVLLTDYEVKDIIQTYGKIECLALENAIENGGDKWEENIIAALYSLSKVETKTKVAYGIWAPKNAAFHDAIISACDSASLIHIRNELHQMNEWFIRLSYKFADKQTLLANHQEHKKIANEVIAKRKTLASNHLYAHINGGIDNLIANLKKNGLIRGAK